MLALYLLSNYLQTTIEPYYCGNYHNHSATIPTKNLRHWYTNFSRGRSRRKKKGIDYFYLLRIGIGVRGSDWFGLLEDWV